MSFLAKLFGGSPQVVPTHLDTWESFSEHVLKSELPVIVDVWSTSCAPCRQLAPVLTRVATKYDGRIRVAELTTDAEPRLLMELNVRATPTILVFHRGKEMGRMAGFRPESWFDEMIEAEFPLTDASS